LPSGRTGRHPRGWLFQTIPVGRQLRVSRANLPPAQLLRAVGDFVGGGLPGNFGGPMGLGLGLADRQRPCEEDSSLPPVENCFKLPAYFEEIGIDFDWSGIRAVASISTFARSLASSLAHSVGRAARGVWPNDTSMTSQPAALSSWAMSTASSTVTGRLVWQPCRAPV